LASVDNVVIGTTEKLQDSRWKKAIVIQRSTRGMLSRKFAHTVVAAFRLHKIVAGAQVIVKMPDAGGAGGGDKQAGVVLKRRGGSGLQKVQVDLGHGQKQWIDEHYVGLGGEIA